MLPPASKLLDVLVCVCKFSTSKQFVCFSIRVTIFCCTVLLNCTMTAVCCKLLVSVIPLPSSFVLFARCSHFKQRPNICHSIYELQHIAIEAESGKLYILHVTHNVRNQMIFYDQKLSFNIATIYINDSVANKMDLALESVKKIAAAAPPPSPKLNMDDLWMKHLATNEMKQKKTDSQSISKYLIWKIAANHFNKMRKAIRWSMDYDLECTMTLIGFMWFDDAVRNVFE